MKVSEILNKSRVGEVINNKRVLAVLKRKGLIYGYSQWGYLESARLWYKESDGYRGNHYCELFPKGNAPKVCDTEFGTMDEVFDYIGGSEVEYKGCKFRTKYLDGCFNPYLQLVEKCGCREREVNPRMSIWGRVV